MTALCYVLSQRGVPTATTLQCKYLQNMMVAMMRGDSFCLSFDATECLALAVSLTKQDPFVVQKLKIF